MVPEIGVYYNEHKLMHRSKKFYATVLIAVAAIISGANIFLTKIAVGAMADPVGYTVLKDGLAAILLVGLVVMLGKYREIRALRKKQILQLVAIGAVGGSLPFALYFTGLTMTSAVNASLIHNTLFLWVFLLAVPFLKERMSGFQWVGVGAIFVANLFVGGFTGFRWNAGEAMILGATVLWAAENIIAKYALREISSSVVGAARMAIGSAILLVFLAASGRIDAFAAINPASWGWTMLTALLLFGYVSFWYESLKNAPATYVATLLVPASLVTNALSAIFITGALTPSAITSGALSLAGAALVVIFVKRNAGQIAAPAFGSAAS